ncbi:MAG: hypothetical protein O7F71_12990 [Gammaproteobacteria bacterium]|nr:hypothetical protein [Gammaproteobacteria bacterium]
MLDCIPDESLRFGLFSLCDLRFRHTGQSGNATDRAQAKATFFRIFMQYQIALAFLNLVPYIALKIMA